MNLDFLFWFFLAGIIIATVQDLKRREIDFWLCGIMLFGGISFIIFYSIINQTLSPAIQLAISLIILFGLMELFYHSRVFAGGDAHLLFALSALFIGATWIATIKNISTYIIFLLFAGAVYGLFSLLYLYAKNFRQTNKQLRPKLKKIRYPLILSVGILMILFSGLSPFLPMAGILLIIYPLLFVFSKTLEEKIMTRIKKPSEIQEGDWLAKNVKLKTKTLKYSWDGLTKEDVKLLRKEKKSIKVKEGIPFAPAFLIAHILYWLFRDNILNIF